MKLSGAVLLLCVPALAGCTASSTADSGLSDRPWTPERAPTPAVVHGAGTILDAGDAPVLCLGKIADSLPPQCTGVALADWDWAAVDGEDSASGVTWGTYSLAGEWDGETLTVTRAPVPFDSSIGIGADASDPFDQSLPSGRLRPGPGRQVVTPELRDAVADLVSTTFINGRVVLEVPFDDGTLQASVDDRYGDDAVVVTSILRPRT